LIAQAFVKPVCRRLIGDDICYMPILDSISYSMR